MRTIVYGLLATGLTLSIAGSANASFSGHFGGFQPLPFGHFGHVGPVGHFGHGDMRPGRTDIRLGHVDWHFGHGSGGGARHNDWRGRYWNNLGAFGTTVFDVSPGPASDPAAAGGDLVIYAPNYVSDYGSGPARRTVASGPKIIYIGAQPKSRTNLPVVIYGSAVADAAE
jgi:hypothetical protein